MTYRPVGADGFARVAELDHAVASIAGLVDSVSSAAHIAGRDGDAVRIDRIRALEDMKSLICAVQSDLAVAFDVSQRRRQAEAGAPVELHGRGVATQALARTTRITPPREHAARDAKGSAPAATTRNKHPTGEPDQPTRPKVAGIPS